MYTITIEYPKNDNELFGAWCDELQLSAFGESESEAFYNLIENIPIYFDIQNENQRNKKFVSKRESFSSPKKQKFLIPEFA